MRVASLLPVGLLAASSALASSSFDRQQGRDLAGRSWARYKTNRDLRGTPSEDGIIRLRPRAVVHPPSPIPIINGGTIDKSIQQQIKGDVEEVIKQFKDVPEFVRDEVKKAFDGILSQALHNKTPQEQYETVSKAINDKLNEIQYGIDDSFFDFLMADQTTDKGNIAALKACVQQIVAMGGQSKASDGDCLTASGLSVSSYIDQFNAFIDINDFHISVNEQNAVADEITKYLASSNLIPPMQELIAHANEAIKNVVATTSALEVKAKQAAFACWIQALETISEVPIKERQMKCNTQGLSGTTAEKGTTLANIEEAYKAVVNQYAGVLPANIAKTVQAIGDAALSLNLGAFDRRVRDTINGAIISNVAITSGETASLVGSLISCLNSVYDDTPENDCNPNRDPGVLGANFRILSNYLDQFVSTLPKVLVKKINATIAEDLRAADPLTADEVTKQINDLFAEASLGSDYSSCAQGFILCVNDGIVNGAANAKCLGTLPEACGALPGMAPSPVGNQSNPYNDIVNGLRQRSQIGSKRAASATVDEVQSLRERAAANVARHLAARSKAGKRGAAFNALHNKRSAAVTRISLMVAAENLVKGAHGMGAFLSTGRNGGIAHEIWQARLAAALLPASNVVDVEA